jgi:hypothetical protein
MTNSLSGEIGSNRRRNKRPNDETVFRHLALGSRRAATRAQVSLFYLFFYYSAKFYLQLCTTTDGYNYPDLPTPPLPSTTTATTMMNSREREGMERIWGQKGPNDETPFRRLAPGELFFYSFFIILLIILTTRLCTMMITRHQHNTPPSSLVGLRLPTLQYKGLESVFTRLDSRVPYTNGPKRRINVSWAISKFFLIVSFLFITNNF